MAWRMGMAARTRGWFIQTPPCVHGLLSWTFEPWLKSLILSLFIDLAYASGRLPVLHFVLFFLFFSLCSIPLNDYKLLVCDIQQLLVAVTIHSCSSSGSQYFRIIEDLITLLGFMQTSKMRRTQGEDCISETQYICKIHQCSSTVLCSRRWYQLSSSAAGSHRAVASLSISRVETHFEKK